MDLPLNSAPAKIMHIDINSCFATIEQQANPFLRGKPLAVVAHDYSRGCILAASIEAKRLGIKTGMILSDAKKICSKLLTREPDPDKYRYVHKQFREIISDYSDDFHPKSIDEFVINMSEILSSRKRCHPALAVPDPSFAYAGSASSRDPGSEPGMTCVSDDSFAIAKEIKQRIREEIGEWISVSVGIGTNRFWAKQAAGFKKPDGLTLMNSKTALEIYANLKLTDLHGINVGYEKRLNRNGIYTPLDFLNADLFKLKAAFQSVNSDYWYTRLRGYETCLAGRQVDSVEFGRKSFGNTYSMPGGPVQLNELKPILMKLTTKASERLRKKGYVTKGIHLGIRYKNYPYWHKGKTLNYPLFDNREIYKELLILLNESPRKPVANLAVTCFNLLKYQNPQLNLFENIIKKRSLIDSIDKINSKFEKQTVFPARMLSQVSKQADAIGFGNVKEI